MPDQRPSSTKLLASMGGLMILIPIVLLLAAVFIGIAVQGGFFGIAAAAMLVWIVWTVARRGRAR